MIDNFDCESGTNRARGGGICLGGYPDDYSGVYIVLSI